MPKGPKELQWTRHGKVFTMMVRREDPAEHSGVRNTTFFPGTLDDFHTILNRKPSGEKLAFLQDALGMLSPEDREYLHTYLGT